MNEESPNMNQTKPKPEHGTVKSYVIGFILSLVFTLIPYFLVVEQIITGIVLLAVILAFAMLQMLVQVIFFLHLGRERKPKWQTGFLISTVFAIFIVVAGSIWIMSHLQHNMTPAEMIQHQVDDEAIYQIDGKKTGSCKGVYAKHWVTIKNNVAAPNHITAKLCDTITFLNEDETLHEIAFGTHPNHGTYAGNTGKVLRTGRGYTITLSQPGSYLFHDHLNADTHGTFTVEP